MKREDRPRKHWASKANFLWFKGSIIRNEARISDRDETIRRLQSEITALESWVGPRNQLILSLRNQLKAHKARTVDDRRNQVFRRAAIDLVPDEFTKEFSRLPSTLVKDLGEGIVALSRRLDQKFAEVKALSEITEHMNAGMFFDEVLNHVFENFEKIIPYERISVALIEESNEEEILLRWSWARAQYDPMVLRKGYTIKLNDTGLDKIASAKLPRIINDLEDHLRKHPKSMSTRSVMEEGIRSSLTCPLVVRGKVNGFIFFSSLQLDTYRDQHIELFLQIAGELALALEKSRAYEDLYLRNEFIRKVFGQYVTNEVAEAALNRVGPLALGGDRRKVTVLMADLRGFTQMSEILSPEDVVDALNVFLGTMTDVVMKYGGSVDNFIGDALMAVFGVPITKPDDAARAVACAIEMQNSLASVNAEIDRRNLPDLAMGVGLSTGEVVAGNIGSESRLKYSVIGSTVNLAARIEGIASGGQIFASESTYNEVRDIVRTDGHLAVQLKGLNHPAIIHDIISIGGEYVVDKLMKVVVRT